MKKKINEDNLAKKYLQLLKEKEKEEKQIISNYEYISWLEQFTRNHKGFSSDSWLYKKEEITEEDYTNVDKLYLFYSVISNYCHNFYINVEGREHFEFEQIHIKHNNVGYQLSLFVGQGSFVSICREDPKPDAIVFEDIMNNIVPEEFKTKEELLKKFEKILMAMKDADIPTDVAINIAKKLLQVVTK